MSNEIYTWQTDVLAICLRYFLLAGLAYVVYYLPIQQRSKTPKIQIAMPDRNQIVREILHSCSTLIIYCATSWLVFRLYALGYTRIYTTSWLNNLPYTLLSFVCCIVLHDAYFYWTHRLMHHRLLYAWIHRTHHKSVNPTPWASFAFHPLEAMISVGIIPLIVFCLPVHPYVLFAFLTFMTAINVMGHLGFELFSAKFMNSKSGRWINTSTNHNLHHQKGKGQYGLYFTFWDRIMGTMG